MRARLGVMSLRLAAFVVLFVLAGAALLAVVTSTPVGIGQVLLLALIGGMSLVLYGYTQGVISVRTADSEAVALRWTWVPLVMTVVPAVIAMIAHSPSTSRQVPFTLGVMLVVLALGAAAGRAGVDWAARPHRQGS